VRSLRRSGGLLAIDNALSHGDQPAALDAPIEAESSLSRALGHDRRGSGARSSRPAAAAPGRLPVMATCLVTGGAGFLGSHLCDELLARENRVICVDNLETGSLENITHIRDPKFVALNVDITEPFYVDEPVDMVFHLASPASPIDYLRLPLHRPARSTAIRQSIPSARATGATSTRSARAASTTKPSATPRR
jgi:dTDP-glucose 4,6-dehydratase